MTTCALAVVSLGAVSASSLAAVPQTIPTGPTYIVLGYTSGAYLWHSSDYMETSLGPYAQIKPVGSSSQEFQDENNSGLCLTFVPSVLKISETSCTGSTKQLWNSKKQSNGAWQITNVYDGSSYCWTEGSKVGDAVELLKCGGSRQDWIFNNYDSRRGKHRSAMPQAEFRSGGSSSGSRPAR
jgi:hypothetical protein